MADEDQYEHYNYDEKTQKQMNSGHSGKQRSKKEAEQHTNQHDVGGERLREPFYFLVSLLQLTLTLIVSNL